MKIHNISKKTYSLSSIQIDDGLDFIEREQFQASSSQMLDIYPGFWMLYLFDLPAGQMYLQSGKKMLSIAGPKALYVPPYSLIDQKFSSGLSQWQAYSCFREPEPYFPKQPVCFPWDKNWRIFDFSDIASIFKKDLNFVPVGRGGISSSIVDKACHAIRENYKESLTLNQIAKEINVSHFSMTHAFSLEMGLSPISYRNRIRVFDSLRRISLGESVTQACYMSGFSDYSRFYRNFNQVLNVSPSDFARRGFSYKGQEVQLKGIRASS
ncbi:MAG: helix-turn-helix transcriptional regulator [Alphaproteobacteria bacterium]|nr:helix-turn-helix transcriptional regulator [Alphaproteobacteria bacterium]